MRDIGSSTYGDTLVVPAARSMPAVAAPLKALAGLAVGAAGGILARRLAPDPAAVEWLLQNVVDPIGQVFLRLLFMIVVPLVATSVPLGVWGIGVAGRVGRVGAQSLAWFVGTSVVAAALGAAAMVALRPGSALPAAERAALVAPSTTLGLGPTMPVTAPSTSLLVNVIPLNPIKAAADGDLLGLLFFSAVFAVASLRLPDSTRATLRQLAEAVYSVVAVIIGFATRLVPLGAAALMFGLTARLGSGIVSVVGAFVLALLLTLAVYQFLVLGTLARLATGLPVRSFFRGSWMPIVTAFATASSSATLPTALRAAERELKVPVDVAGFVLPLGAALSRSGTALFQAATAVFVAQAFAIPLTGYGYTAIVAMSALTALAAAGIPSGALPMLVVMLGLVGLPREGAALIVGVDQLTGMARTVPNVTSALLASVAIARRGTRGEVETRQSIPENGDTE